MNLRQLLESLELSQYVETFADNDIDGAALLDLEESASQGTRALARPSRPPDEGHRRIAHGEGGMPAPVVGDVPAGKIAMPPAEVTWRSEPIVSRWRAPAAHSDVRRSRRLDRTRRPHRSRRRARRHARLPGRLRRHRSRATTAISPSSWATASLLTSAILMRTRTRRNAQCVRRATLSRPLVGWRPLAAIGCRCASGSRPAWSWSARSRRRTAPPSFRPSATRPTWRRGCRRWPSPTPWSSPTARARSRAAPSATSISATAAQGHSRPGACLAGGGRDCRHPL